MRKPETERERDLARKIDKKGHAVLQSGKPWKNRILKFSNPYDSLAEREKVFIQDRLAWWKGRINRARSAKKPST